MRQNKPYLLHIIKHIDSVIRDLNNIHNIYIVLLSLQPFLHANLPSNLPVLLSLETRRILFCKNYDFIAAKKKLDNDMNYSSILIISKTTYLKQPTYMGAIHIRLPYLNSAAHGEVYQTIQSVCSKRFIMSVYLL